jgi:hypothetical protein
MPVLALAGNKTRACLIVAIVHAFLPPVLREHCADAAGFRFIEIK